MNKSIFALFNFRIWELQSMNWRTIFSRQKNIKNQHQDKELEELAEELSNDYFRSFLIHDMAVSGLNNQVNGKPAQYE